MVVTITINLQYAGRRLRERSGQERRLRCNAIAPDMLMNIYAVIVAASALCGIPVGAQNSRCTTTVLSGLGDLRKRPSIASPDGRYRIVLGVRTPKDGYAWLRVYANDQELAAFELRDLSASMFVDWSPDSRAFYFMWSNGGAAGGYEVRTFRIADNGVTETFATRTAERDFDRRHPCPTRRHNVYAGQWLEGSATLLLVVQVYPTSDCKEMGLYRGYVVRTTDGTIVRGYSEAQLKSTWPRDCRKTFDPWGK
jgi:hypothetical protein